MAPPGHNVTSHQRRWPVDVQAIFFLEPVEPQAANLAVHIGAHDHVIGPVKRSHGPGWIDGIPDTKGDIVVSCVVLADDADGAEAVADQAVELAVGYLMHHDPPGLLEPLMTDVRVGPELT